MTRLTCGTALNTCVHRGALWSRGYRTTHYRCGTWCSLVPPSHNCTASSPAPHMGGTAHPCGTSDVLHTWRHEKRCQWRHKQFTEKAIKNVVNTVYEGKENLVPRCRNIYRSSLFYTATKRKQKSLLFKPRSFWLVYWKAGKSEKQRREAETQIRLRRVKHLSVDVCCPLWLGSNTKAVGEDGWMAFCDKIVATDKQVEMNIIFLVKPCW